MKSNYDNAFERLDSFIKSTEKFDVVFPKFQLVLKEEAAAIGVTPENLFLMWMMDR